MTLNQLIAALQERATRYGECDVVVVDTELELLAIDTIEVKSPRDGDAFRVYEREGPRETDDTLVVLG